MTESTLTTDGLEVFKGSREKILVRVWTNKGYRYVSVAVQTLNQGGEYVFMKGRSFALQPGEARDLAEALVKIAAEVENGQGADADAH